MKIKHKNSGEIINSFPYYCKINGLNGYLTLCENNILFFYYSNNSIEYYDITDEFEIF
jgi:hypothetical protein